jgi:hypothetical protein
MNIKERVRAILLQPGPTWKQIRDEETNIKEMYRSYALILAAIPALAYLIGMTVVGLTFLGIRYRAPFLDACGYAIVYYLLSLVSLYIFALTIDALARRLNGESDIVRALKVALYSSTPYWVAGVLFLVPALSPLVFLLGLYGFYLLYTGLHELIALPPERRKVYFILLIGISLALSTLTCFAANVLFPQGKMGAV